MHAIASGGGRERPYLSRIFDRSGDTMASEATEKKDSDQKVTRRASTLAT